jgi:hypothetical protein
MAWQRAQILSLPTSSFVGSILNVMGNPKPDVGGWLARVTAPDKAAPRYFIAAVVTAEEAETIIADRPEVRGDPVEILCNIDVQNVIGFTLTPGEVRRIDYDRS